MHEIFLTNLSYEQPRGVHESDMDHLLTNTMSLLFTGVTSAHVVLCLGTCSISVIYLACAVYVSSSVSVFILRQLNVRRPFKFPALQHQSKNRTGFPHFHLMSTPCRLVMFNQGWPRVCFSARRQPVVSSAAEH